ncbi:COP9 signalosome complex subunit 7 [Culicoides brevitarsis]|uniref:COP9 signalosome complex subunit 7 n=1 Tax=Culicoides brevitarsis TaxID=469753 RepID=UPI00307CBCD2
MKNDDGTASDVNITSSSSAVATSSCPASGNSQNFVTQNPNSLLSEHYVQLMRKATTAEQTVDVIRQALEATGVHVFGELLHMPNVQALEKSEHAKSYHTLNVFAYGTYRQYLQQKDNLLDLTPVMKKKLQHLTIVSMAIKCKCIPYSSLLDELDIKHVRDLEDLIIEAIYADIIHGKLDQKNKQLEVDNAIGRDIQPGDVSQICNTLQEWCDSCETVLACIEEQIRRANSEKQKRIKHKDAVDKEIVNLKKAIKTASNETDGDCVMVGDSREASSGHEVRKKPSKSSKSGKASGSSVRLHI